MLVLDGGLATSLTSYGVLPSDSPLWSSQCLIESSGQIALLESHRKFLTSGADIITTASYQISLPLLKECAGMNEAEAKEVIRLSAKLAKKARDDFWNEHGKDLARTGRNKPLVAGSVGPYGACLRDGSEYSGIYVDSMTSEELKVWHQPRIEALVEEQVDFLAVETIPSVKEALAIMELLEDIAPQQVYWMSFSCKDGRSISHGETFEETVNLVLAQKRPGLKYIGVNCVHPRFVPTLLKSAAERVQKEGLQFIVYPNSGQSWSPEKRWHGEKMGLDDFAASLKEFNLPVGIIGGCCQYSPDDISVLRQAVERNFETVRNT